MDKIEINIFLVLTFLIITTMLAGLFYFMFQFRKRKIQEELEKLISVNRERERIIRDLHDELGGNLNSISMIGDLILKKNLDDDKLYECIAKMANTSKNISQQIKTVIWTLDVEKDTLYNLAEYIKQYVSGFFEVTDTELEITNRHNYENVYVSGMLRKNVFLVVKEAVNNISKHAEASLVKIEMKVIKNRFCIAITDNGKGIDNRNTSGNGMHNMQKRMEEIGGTFSIESSTDGTHLSIAVPLTDA